MKHTMKKPSYYLLSQAMDGDEKAIEKILAFYDPYISKCCLRPLYDEYGNVYIVLGDLKQIIRNVENLQELVKSQSFTATKIRKSTDIELTKLKAELERVKKLKKSIYEDYKDELISKEEFLSYREDYQQKETLYSKQIETLEEKKKESVTEDVFETPWLRRLLELKDIEELDRDIIVEMIDQITVYENRKLKISYNFGNELEHLFSSVYCEDLEKKAI